ncbi:MAG: dipeptide epimerase [Gemmatimonadetes bacterium]|nr:dipeptide epimerase [Gemmatimonadota bacterium]MBK7714714.1 dipeptide epimerase [Gemmatimonadota bacterium]MBK7924717.1 dipeptide epimerase [Gemmatimonadota bacterium]MBK9690577.1 dipeptide epimerase [Gemmatimonadota bacterium]
MEAEVLNLRTRHPFIISRGGQSDYRTIWVRLVDHDGVEGWGEAAPARIYGESTETVLASLQNYAEHLAASPFHLEDIERQWETQMRLNPAARCALSAALHDLMGKKLGVPVYQLWGLNPAKAPRSTFTIGIDTAEKLRQKVLEAEEYPILKIKLGTDRDVEILKTIRDLTAKELRVDANTGWNTKQAIRMLPVLEEFGVTVLEQPLPADDLDGLAQVTRHSRIPVIADESCLVAADIPRLVGKVDGINIKLAKCGSLREALRMIAIARAHHLMVMVGCMIESSIAITAAAHFTPLVDIVDLDGAALLANDPFAGATIAGGQVRLPTGPGLGLSRR